MLNIQVTNSLFNGERGSVRVAIQQKMEDEGSDFPEEGPK